LTNERAARMADLFIEINRFALPALGVLVVVLCTVCLLRRGKTKPPEVYLLNAVNHDKHPLPRFENSIGRRHNCDVVLNYPSVSRLHAVIARRREGWVLMDTGSQYGTKLDGLPVKDRAPLSHGQCITFGGSEFIFCDPEEERLTLKY
jgi:pSer/pThr/pTyr-binding forkhead associated (FHA) protein